LFTQHRGGLLTQVNRRPLTMMNRSPYNLPPMDAFAQVALPLLIMLAMAVVGLELTVTDFGRVLHYPMQATAALLGQLILLPLLGAGLILLLRPQASVAGGLILVAAAPQAIISNYFCLLARSDVALSVTLTAISTVLAIVSTPLIAGWGFALLMEPTAGFILPAESVVKQVASGLLTPVAAGMLLRHYAPAFAKRHLARLKLVSLLAMAGWILLVMASQGETIRHNLAPILAAAGSFTAVAGAIGLAVANALRWPRSEVVTVAVGFPARSLSVATLLAVNVLGRLEFLSFAVIFFLAQIALIVPAVLLTRPAGAKSGGAAG
jgi:BASS family bile acid:Na+ symporter